MAQESAESLTSAFIGKADDTEWRAVTRGDIRYRTANGAPIVDGMRAFNNNLDVTIVRVTRGAVPGSEFHASWDGWFECESVTGERMPIMDGERLTTRHPFTGERADDAARVAIADLDRWDYARSMTEALDCVKEERARLLSERRSNLGYAVADLDSLCALYGLTALQTRDLMAYALGWPVDELPIVEPRAIPYPLA
jgi:hypothetical protein